MARWLDGDAETVLDLLHRSMTSPWQGDAAIGRCSQRLARWEAAPGAPAGGTGCPWAHEVLRCPRPVPEDVVEAARAAGEVPPARCHFYMHRMVLDPSVAGELGASLDALAQGSRPSEGEQKSNMGGFHSSSDLCSWDAVRAGQLPALLAAAIGKVTSAESLTLGREVGALRAELDAWLNVSHPGDWNHFHSHPGAALSGTYFARDGGCCRRGGLLGRLVFLTGAPSSVGGHHFERLQCQPPGGPEPAGEGASEGGGGAGPGGGPLGLLAVDPVPGTLVVFPSFVPHFVTPFDGPATLGGESLGPRVSVAFNCLAA